MFYPGIHTKPEQNNGHLILFFMMLVFAASTAVGFVSAAQASDTSHDIQSGQLLFQKNCAACHGSEGGGGVGVPLNMSDFLSTTSDEYLKKTIQLGRPGRIMPAFSTLSETQVNNLVHYIRSWKPKIKTPVYSQKK
ncbi:MAG: cytochrome c [gamma proteobacterium symbiont of Bathyaustriella thionipta]|nr:cytochrome c [gamma proteobacterium symbiont of Bathyaustriella thionipta]MCU7950400.1 cytochrome c [gamma proteobacterium symbiont of Bathyaustriella thionipta]MCU7953651.1 cytochrome c [gamma proteobacterium symbiont of Bathyaustriella thionipta]MCU7956902.1 cytochrome c [gamma proteobacterium symbiont of Bathyaustriella thionipta]MCU7968173.1 cytochrome c [gamma proteobacterium symbiont of Bathyaustriella thionipta]